MQESEAMASAVQQQDQIDKDNILRAKAESDAKFTKGEGLVKEGLDKGQKGIEKLKGMLAATPKGIAKAKAAADAAKSIQGGATGQFGNVARQTLAEETSGLLASQVPGAGQTSLAIPGGGAGDVPFGAFGTKGDYGMSSLSAPPPVVPGAAPPVTITPPPTTAPGAIDAISKTTDVVEQTGAAKGGLSAALKAYKAQRAANQAIKAGKAVGQTTSAVGAGWGAMSAGAKGNLIGAAAGLAGEGLKRWGGDDDETELNAAEWSGELLAGAGTGIGVASAAGTIAGMVGAGALYGSAVPGLGTAIGAVAGLGYGAYKALAGRKKARRAKAKATAAKKSRVDKYNKKVMSNLQTANLQARAGEMEQKTYSGYDLGRNVVARGGGMRMGIPRYGYAA
tara:strand:- start:262 stop:1443 length:1182 start_codon:yes stop_codon:yes gene_type:complete